MPPEEERPGVREQFGRTRSAFGRLVGAHRELLRAEIGEITAQLRIIAICAGILLGLGLLLVNLLYVGGWLFLGEWLFGSMGWGLLHGTLFTTALAVAVGIVLAGGPARASIVGFAAGLIVTVLFSILFASNVLRSIGDALATGLRLSVPALEPAAVIGGVLVGIVLAIAMLVVGWRAGGPRAGIAGLVGGLILGFIVGAVLLGVRWETHTAVAFSIALGLVTWIAVSVVVALREGIDTKKRFGRLYPKETISTVKETRGWLEQQWQRQRRKLTSR